MDLLNRFTSYAALDTRSKEREEGKEKPHPSSLGQKVLINLLLQQLEEMGVTQNILQLSDGSSLVQFPATAGCENAPHVVLAAHVDTYPSSPGAATTILHHYAGGDIQLPKDGVIIPANDLAGLEGKDIITASGDSLLGADDKCGVAALMDLIDKIVNLNLPHGPLTFWFATDEEIGEVGVEFLPAGTAEKWDIFWTVDGVQGNVVDNGCFYGAKVSVEFRGNDTHPGVEGKKLKPAHYAAARFISLLGDGPSPWTTEGEQSFIYVPAFPGGTAGNSKLTVYPRTFNCAEFESMEAIIRKTAEEASKPFGVEAVVGKTELMYVTTEVAIAAHPELLEPGLEAMRNAGYDKVQLHKVRAGTDGAMLNKTFSKIPAPNMGTGSRNLHGVREFLVVEEFLRLPGILQDMLNRYSQMTMLSAK
ncbi:MAG: M20/M25/M40 family metallo-hydrolase [Parcubacteria group bacterium]